MKGGTTTGVGFLLCICIGLAVGLAGNRAVPDVGYGGLAVSALLGASGASVGAVVAGLISETWLWGFSAWSPPAALAGAVALLLVYGRIARATR